MNATDKVNILLVDDQPAKLLSYEVILQELGENLLKASSATEALNRLLKHDVAVILVDVCMPDLDGFELAAMIREHPRCRETAIIFISAIHLTDLDRIRGYARCSAPRSRFSPSFTARRGSWSNSIACSKCAWRKGPSSLSPTLRCCWKARSAEV